MDRIDRIANALCGYRFSTQNEDELQRGIAECFEKAGLAFIRESYFSPKDRPDFLVGPRTPYGIVGGVVVEVKVDGSLAALTRQIHRYAGDRRAEGIVVVTTRARHLDAPRALNGKRVEVVSLLGGTL